MVRCIFALTLPFLFFQGFLRETAEISYMWEKSLLPHVRFRLYLPWLPGGKREKKLFCLSTYVQYSQQSKLACVICLFLPPPLQTIETTRGEARKGLLERAFQPWENEGGSAREILFRDKLSSPETVFSFVQKRTEGRLPPPFISPNALLQHVPVHRTHTMPKKQGAEE